MVTDDERRTIEFNDLMEQLDLSVSEAAALLDVGERVVRRWAKGEPPPHPTAMRVLRYLAADPKRMEAWNA